MSVAAAPAGRREIEAIAVVGFGHGVSHFFHLMIPPLFPWLMADFGLSFTQAGLLTGVFLLEEQNASLSPRGVGSIPTSANNPR